MWMFVFWAANFYSSCFCFEPIKTLCQLDSRLWRADSRPTLQTYSEFFFRNAFKWNRYVLIKCIGAWEPAARPRRVPKSVYFRKVLFKYLSLKSRETNNVLGRTNSTDQQRHGIFLQFRAFTVKFKVHLNRFYRTRIWARCGSCEYVSGWLRENTLRTDLQSCNQTKSMGKL